MKPINEKMAMTAKEARIIPLVEIQEVLTFVRQGGMSMMCSVGSILVCVNCLSHV